MQKTNIPWTEYTWNPTIGCSKKCDYCYASKLHNMRHKAYLAGKKLPKQYAKPFEEIQLFPDRLNSPLSKRKPCKIFVGSMADIFDPSVPFEFIDKVFGIMFANPWHTYQVLTKRPRRWAQYIRGNPTRRLQDQEYIWAGVTIEHPDYKSRADILRQIPAAVRFISIEPCLADMGELNLEGIHQVILGGESGPGARPMYPDWPRGVRDQCVGKVPFFFKQWGKYKPDKNGTEAVFNDGSHMRDKTGKFAWLEGYGYEQMMPVGKKKAGRLLDGKEWSQYPKGR